jgi:hypothetical protein
MSSLSAAARLITALALLAILASTTPSPTHTAFATSPCDSATGGPGDPGGDPTPDIGGAVIEVSPIQGATMQLYRCVSGQGVLVASTTTSSSGTYGFDVTTAGFYYVQASMTGPLAGLSPASGTSNPSPVIAVTPGDLAVNFAFQLVPGAGHAPALFGPGLAPLTLPAAQRQPTEPFRLPPNRQCHQGAELLRGSTDVPCHHPLGLPRLTPGIAETRPRRECRGQRC